MPPTRHARKRHGEHYTPPALAAFLADRGVRALDHAHAHAGGMVRVLDPAWGQRDDATVVKKLRAAGAVITGKLGLHEYATGWPDPDTGFRIPKNPWDLARTPGGSSSGTGAAIAGGLVLGGLGTDTGGSIRGPASYCGISGMKQTFGRVSKEGCVPLGYSLDHIGPMARSARDCALMLQVMAGYDPADPMAGLGKMRPGHFLAAFGDTTVQTIANDIDPDVLRAMMSRDDADNGQIPPSRGGYGR